VKTLAFSRRCEMRGGRRIRPLAFEERSMLPVSAACLVASAVRETLASLFGEPVALKLYEPVIPTPEAWTAIARNATIYRMRTSSTDAAVIVRPADASALTAAAFGEREGRTAALSAIERTVLARTIQAITLQFGPICGSGLPEAPLETEPQLCGYTTFFELQIERPVNARVGIALRRDPVPEAQPGVSFEDVMDLPVELQVHVDVGRFPAADVGALEPGAVLPVPAGALRGALLLAGRTLATGECGVYGHCYALALDRTLTGRDLPAI
jgi:flagellar motor switch/type III secretory pathway protein FliN